jgi:hypothetical protein
VKNIVADKKIPNATAAGTEGRCDCHVMGDWEWLRPPDNNSQGDKLASLELFPWFPIDHLPSLSHLDRNHEPTIQCW